MDKSDSLGKVYLLGAGPGSIDYLTCRGQQLLLQADALVYDALVSSSLLQQLSADCELWHVGKRGGLASTPQAEINRLLVRLAQAGKRVVRLKAGDPFVFGRAAAEIQALKAADCDFEVVPGLSSALVAPLLASIPLSDPVLSRGFGVFTAHDLDALNWEAIAPLQTLVFLMGRTTAAGDLRSPACQPKTPRNSRRRHPLGRSAPAANLAGYAAEHCSNRR